MQSNHDSQPVNAGRPLPDPMTVPPSRSVT